MIDALHFVRGAVSKQDLVPVLTHFLLRDNKITGYNGLVALCAPLALNFNLCPKASQLVAAVTACGDVPISLSLQGTKLSLCAGDFHTFVECVDTADFPNIETKGVLVPLPEHFISVLKLLKPFIGIDASRPWICGVLFSGHSAYASNNIILVETWLGSEFPARVTVPSFAVEELLRIGEAPTSMLIGENTLTFRYANGAWLHTCTPADNWPDVGQMLDSKTGPCVPIPGGLAVGLEKLVPFVGDNDYVYLREDGISTTVDPTVDGTAIHIPDLGMKGCFDIKQLRLLLTVASEIDISAYPDPCLFYGSESNSRGIIVGIRL